MKRLVKSAALKENYTEERCFITEVLNTPDYPKFSLAKARIEPGITTEIHTLTDTDEVYYILSGTGEPEVAGERMEIVVPGDLVFIPANSSQRIKNIGGEDLVFLCVCSPRFETRNYR